MNHQVDVRRVTYVRNNNCNFRRESLLLFSWYMFRIMNVTEAKVALLVLLPSLTKRGEVKQAMKHVTTTQFNR